MKKKLRLSRETIRLLSADPLDRVAGGVTDANQTCPHYCTELCNATRKSDCCDTYSCLTCAVFSCQYTCGCY